MTQTNSTIDGKKLWKSFGHAFRGIWRLLTTEQNARIHFGSMVLVGVLAVAFHINHLEAAILFFAVVLVFALEIINTAIERTLDLLHPHEHETVGKVKDAMAGAVLISAFIALVVALLVFYPYVRHLLFTYSII